MISPVPTVKLVPANLPILIRNYENENENKINENTVDLNEINREQTYEKYPTSQDNCIILISFHFFHSFWFRLPPYEFFSPLNLPRVFLQKTLHIKELVRKCHTKAHQKLKTVYICCEVRLWSLKKPRR